MLCAIIIVLLLYSLVVIFGRRVDKRDKAKVGSRGFFQLKIDSFLLVKEGIVLLLTSEDCQLNERILQVTKETN